MSMVSHLHLDGKARRLYFRISVACWDPGETDPMAMVAELADTNYTPFCRSARLI